MEVVALSMVSYDGVCVANKVQYMKVFNLMSGVNETRVLVNHKYCECKCGLNESACNSKWQWNQDESRYECKQLDD